MKEDRLKVEIELHVVGDGRTFLNFWNWKTGDDVVAELKNGKLYKLDFPEDDLENEKETEITLEEFTNQVKSKFQNNG